MKTLFRIVLTFLAFVASYFFMYWVPFSLIPGAHRLEMVSMGVSLLVATLTSIFLWRKLKTVSNGLASSILMGGIVVGAVGFIGGFFGPIIFNPGSNQGPLLGLFITGPAGFVIGLIGGSVYWKLKSEGKQPGPQPEMENNPGEIT